MVLQQEMINTRRLVLRLPSFFISMTDDYHIHEEQGEQPIILCWRPRTIRATTTNPHHLLVRRRMVLVLILVGGRYNSSTKKDSRAAAK